MLTKEEAKLLLDVLLEVDLCPEDWGVSPEKLNEVMEKLDKIAKA